jgi:HAMP domain-containing protein
MLHNITATVLTLTVLVNAASLTVAYVAAPYLIRDLTKLQRLASEDDARKAAAVATPAPVKEAAAPPPAPVPPAIEYVPAPPPLPAP